MMTATRHMLMTTRQAAAEIMDDCYKISMQYDKLTGPYKTLRAQMAKSTPMSEIESGLLSVLRYEPGAYKIHGAAVMAEALRDYCDGELARMDAEQVTPGVPQFAGGIRTDQSLVGARS